MVPAYSSLRYPNVPCTVHVNGRANSLVHKGSNGIVKSTVPDVCKTPSPGGPVPVPYPIIISLSRDVSKGSKKVKADGGNSASIKGSELSRCSGDEAGTAGGVKSSTSMKEAKWLLYSFDVKIEGKNACRLGDKLQMNHGNTVCLAGAVNPPVAAPAPSPAFSNKKSSLEKIQKTDTRPTSTTADPKGRAPTGSTAAAVYVEADTLTPVKGKWHYIKSRELCNRYKNLDDDISREEKRGDLSKSEADRLRDGTTEGYVRNDDAAVYADSIPSPPWPKI